MNKCWRKSSKDEVKDDQGQRSRKERESGRFVPAVVVNMWVSKFAQLKVKFALSVQNLITIHECVEVRRCMKLKLLRGCLCKNRAPSSGRKYESLQIFHNNFPFRYLYEKRNRFALKRFFCKIWPIDILHLDGSKMAA